MKTAKRKRRPRPGRLKGKALEQLRRDCFERDGYQCRHIVFDMNVELSLYELFGIGPDVQRTMRCGIPVTWESGHMAHIKSRGAGGIDTLDNVVTKCAHCHLIKEHTLGQK